MRLKSILVGKRQLYYKMEKVYGIAEPPLWRNIKNPGQHTIEETIQKTQALTVAEEAVFVKRLVFLDNVNILADRETIYRLAHAFINRRDAHRELGCHWINYFLKQHLDIKYVLAKTIATNWLMHKAGIL